VAKEVDLKKAIKGKNIKNAAKRMKDDNDLNGEII
jgi:hypothetical protein